MLECSSIKRAKPVILLLTFRSFECPPVHPDNLLFYRLFNEMKHAIISLTGAKSFNDGRTRNIVIADRAATVTSYLIQFFDWLPEVSMGKAS